MASASLTQDETEELKTDVTSEQGYHTPNKKYFTFSNNVHVLHTYNRRYCVVLIFSVMAALQLLLWNTWGPISQSALAAFPDWYPGTIGAIINWSNLSMVGFMFPMMYIVHSRGIRYSTLFAALLMAAGTSLRTYSVDSSLFTVMCYICAALLGIVSTITLATSPLIASVWFAPHERTTATAMCVAITQLGMAFSYLQPFLVRSPEEDSSVEDIRDDIQLLMIYGAVLSIIVFICMLVWFPPRPPTPPSLTATTKKIEFCLSFKSLYRNKNFLKILATYAMQFGIINCWMSVMTFSLLIFGLKQDEIKLIGTVAVFISSPVIFIFGFITDKFYGHLKNTIVVLNTVTLLSFIWILLMTVDVIKYTKWQIYTAVIFGLGSNYGSWPLYFEMMAETSYPVNEAVGGGILNLGMNLVSSLFLFIFSIPTENFEWVIFVLVGSVLVSSILLQLIEEDYTRTLIDDQIIEPTALLSIPRSRADDVEEILKSVHEISKSASYQGQSTSYQL